MTKPIGTSTTTSAQATQAAPQTETPQKKPSQLSETASGGVSNNSQTSYIPPAAAKMSEITKNGGGLEVVRATDDGTPVVKLPNGKQAEMFETSDDAEKALKKYTNIADRQISFRGKTILEKNGRAYEAEGTYRVTVDVKGAITVENLDPLRTDLSSNELEAELDASIKQTLTASAFPISKKGPVSYIHVAKVNYYPEPILIQGEIKED